MTFQISQPGHLKGSTTDAAGFTTAAESMRPRRQKEVVASAAAKDSRCITTEERRGEGSVANTTATAV